MGLIKIKKLSFFEQYAGIKRYFPFGEIKKVSDKSLQWIGTLKSSPLGNEYKVKVVYEEGKLPNVYVLEPLPLPLADGKNFLPHVYDTKKQRLCLYYPDGKEWNKTKSIAQTIMIWAIEWLYHYEIWLVTGEWHGGGVEHGNSKK